MVDHITGRIGPRSTGGGEHSLQLAEDTPVFAVAGGTGLGVAVGGEDGGEGGSVQDALERGVEEAGVAQVVQAAPDSQFSHVETKLSIK